MYKVGNGKPSKSTTLNLSYSWSTSLKIIVGEFDSSGSHQMREATYRRVQGLGFKGQGFGFSSKTLVRVLDSEGSPSPFNFCERSLESIMGIWNRQGWKMEDSYAPFVDLLDDNQFEEQAWFYYTTPSLNQSGPMHFTGNFVREMHEKSCLGLWVRAILFSITYNTQP